MIVGESDPMRSWRSTIEGAQAIFRGIRPCDGLAASRAESKANLAAKLGTAAFREDIRPLVSADVTHDPAAAELVHDELISKLPGEP